MGVLCEVFLAESDKQALTYDYDLEHLESHRIYDYDFACLLSVLREKKHTDKVLKQFKVLGTPDNNGPWIQRVPADLPELLAPVTAADLKNVCKDWHNLMSYEHDVGPLTPVRSYLTKFQKMCKSALKTKRKVYLWTSL